MKLIELINVSDDHDVIAVDDVYFMEAEFYKSDDEDDRWSKAMCKIAEVLDVKKVLENGVVEVNLTQVVESKIEELKEADLFISYDIDDILEDMTSILAGNVSEKWLEKFAAVLNKEVA